MAVEPPRGLTIRDALSRPIFARCRILAGSGGLDREIRWVHIAEVPHVGQVIRGRELVLTTAIGLTGEDMLRSFVEQLAERDASGLVVELVQSFRAIPPDVLAIAERHNMPLVGSTDRIKFVDVTHDLHRVILSAELRSSAVAQEVRERVLDLGLAGTKPVEILRTLAEFSGGQAEYVGHQETIRYPAERTFGGGLKHLTRNVTVLGVLWGRLRLSYPSSPFDSQIERLAGAATTALGQAVAFSMVSRPYGALGSDLVLQTALRGDSSLVTRQWLWRQLDLSHADPAAMVCVATRDGGTESETERLAHAVRTALARMGVRAILCVLADKLAILAPWGSRPRLLEDLATRLRHDRIAVWLGVGDAVAVSGMLDASYRQAVEVVRLSARLGRQLGPAHGDLALYRLLSALGDDVSRWVSETLEPLLRHDEQYSDDLVATLRAYFDSLGSKSDSASILHVHRQTMYYRLRKIESLLGRPLLDPPEQRLALDLAVHLVPFLSPKPDNR